MQGMVMSSTVTIFLPPPPPPTSPHEGDRAIAVVSTAQSKAAVGLDSLLRQLFWSVKVIPAHRAAHLVPKTAELLKAALHRFEVRGPASCAYAAQVRCR